MRTRLSCLLLALLTITAAAPARADAGGGDAPGHPSAAILVEPGTHEGTLGGPDAADFYRLAHPAGMGVQATLVAQTQEEMFFSLRASNGGTGYLGTAGNGTISWTLVWASPSEEVTVGVEARPGVAPISYVLTLAVVPLPDFAVERVEVRALDEDEGGLLTGTRREITVTVANVGAAPGATYLSVYAHTPTDRRARLVAEDSLSLAVGDRVTLTYEWDGTGTVGDVRFAARSWGWHDHNRVNNEGFSNGSVMLPPTGVGVSAFGTYFACHGAYVAGVCAIASLERDESHVSAVGWAGNALVAAYAWKHGAGAPYAGVCTYAFGSFACPVTIP